MASSTINGQNGQNGSQGNVNRKYESPFMTVAQTAEYLQVSKAYLQRLRISGGGPIFLKVSPRRVLYSCEDIASWVESQRRCSTVDPGQGERR